MYACMRTGLQFFNLNNSGSLISIRIDIRKFACTEMDAKSIESSNDFFFQNIEPYVFGKKNGIGEKSI